MMPDDPKDAERLADRLLDEIRLGISLQFDETRIQQEAVIEEHALALSIEEQLRHSGLLAEIARLTQERDAAQSALAESEMQRETNLRASHKFKAELAASQAEVARLKADLDLHIGMHAVTVGEYEKLRKELAASQAEVARLQDRLVGERIAGFRLAEHELAYHARKDSVGDETKAAFHVAACWLSERATELGAVGKPPAATGEDRKAAIAARPRDVAPGEESDGR
jgi:chromosome segregation ATPase